MDPLVIQSFGLAAYAVNIVGFSTRHDQLFRSLLFVSCSLFCIHYVLMGAYVAGANLGINGVRSFVSLRFKGYTWFGIFAVIQTIMSVMVYEGLIDLLPWSASLMSGFALFCLSGIQMRFAMLICALTWMVNALIVGSWGGSLNDITNATLLAFTIYRMKTANEREAQTASL
ncbi:YgjV family protein [Pseudovibrio sp. WM33]|uniref:YgjV family protein n=1 Tax=Pseudovibrio sp. WM33 TaxID=1735585 RepID=UPI0007AEC426|nr:YgjV family protein [Pseudovibrio sp. WM33]KZL28959.1 Inner membrane protein YgjV [Pseudovibrio sp. WM33]